jgi:hypothetical protein
MGTSIPVSLAGGGRIVIGRNTISGPTQKTRQQDI